MALTFQRHTVYRLPGEICRKGKKGRGKVSGPSQEKKVDNRQGCAGAKISLRPDRNETLGSPEWMRDGVHNAPPPALAQGGALKILRILLTNHILTLNR